MSQTCEITGRREKKDAAQKKPDILKRKVAISKKESVRLRISTDGLKVLKQVGGLVDFLKSKDDKSLSPKLVHLKKKLGLVRVEATPKKKEAAPTQEAATTETAAPESAAPAEKVEEKKQEAAEEKPKEE